MIPVVEWHSNIMDVSTNKLAMALVQARNLKFQVNLAFYYKVILK